MALIHPDNTTRYRRSITRTSPSVAAATARDNARRDANRESAARAESVAIGAASDTVTVTLSHAEAVALRRHLMDHDRTPEADAARIRLVQAIAAREADAR